MHPSKRFAAAAAAVLAVFSSTALASTPASQDLAIAAEPGTYTLEWSGTVPAAPTGANNNCDTDPTGVGNDVHTINLSVPDGIYSNLAVSAEFKIEWQPGPQIPGSPTNPPDLVLTVQKDGTTITSSDGGEPHEEVSVLNPETGTYSALACTFAAPPPGTPYTGTLTVTVKESSGEGSTVPASDADPQGLQFSAALVDELQAAESEPLVYIDRDGTVYTCGPSGSAYPAMDWGQMSLDGGDQFNRLGDADTGRMALMGGGDCAIASGLERNEQGNYQMAYAGLSNLAQFTVSTSPDKGHTLTTQPFSSTAPIADRQWLAFTDAQTVFLSYINEQSFGVLHKSTDGGLTYSPPQIITPSPTRQGPLMSMSKEINPAQNGMAALYYPWATGNNLALAISLDAGTTWNHCGLYVSKGRPDSLFMAMDSDNAGNLYLAYTDQSDFSTWLIVVPAAELPKCQGGSGNGASIKDSLAVLPPIQMNRDKAISTIMPWVAAGGIPGRAAVTFYGSPVLGAVDGADVPHVWDVYVSQTLNAFDAHPTVAQVKATTHPNHYDQICTNGLGCQTSGDRGLGDFFSIAYNPTNGELVLTFNRTGKHPGDGINSGPITATTVMRQIDGPSNGGGVVARNGREVVRQSSMDPAGDAYGGFSALYITPTAVQVPALDLEAVTIGDALNLVDGSKLDAGGFTVSMKAQDLSDQALSDALTQSGGQSLIWMFYFWNGYEPYTANATWSPSAGFQFSAGGAVVSMSCLTPSQATVFIGCFVYPGGTPIDGKVDQAAGTIQLTLPIDQLKALADVPEPERSPAEVGAIPGDRLYTAAAYTFANTASASQDLQQALLPIDNTPAMDFLIPGGVVIPPPPVDNPPPVVTTSTTRFGGAFDIALLFPLLGLAALRRRATRAIAILAALAALPAFSADPSSGTISESNPELTYNAGPFLVRNPSAGAIVTEEQCNAALPCDDFELTVDLSPEYAAAHPEDIVLMQWRWDDPFEDYDFRVFDEEGNEVTSAGSASDPENAQIGAINGKYTIRGIPFTVFGGSFTATLKLASPVEAPVPPLPAGLAPEYSTGGPPDGVGDGEGEPSIGYNPKSHKVMFYGGAAQTLRGTFPEELDEPLPDSCDLGWEDVSSVYTGTVSSVIGSDPILFTDAKTGRTWVANMNIPIPVPPTAVGLNSQFEYTDDDGATWTPGQIGPPEGGYDHETVGAGPYPASLSILESPLNGGTAVYYCSQAGFTAFCSRSDDGGLTFPNGFPIYNAETDGFGGIHGHVKVAPDGSVYVPVKACGDTQCVTESDDGGVTWEVRHVPDTTPGPSDPSVGIATDGTVYFCYVNGDGHPHVTISRDKGTTWTDDFDIGAAQHIKNTVFPEAVAGDPDRAACAFVATDKGGNWQALDFPGIWYGFIATTYDAGQSWHTVNVTPDAPIQRESGIWLGGGSHDQRNLLDFNEITMDEHGRVLFGFADGCVGDCETGAAPNSFTSKARVTRQIGGKPLLAQFDPVTPAAPGGACLSGKRDPQASHLVWRLPSSGGAQITSYKIYRGTTKGEETLLTTTPDAKARFDDATADPTVENYTYKITALNAEGEGLFSNIIELPVIDVPHESSCTLPGITLFTDGSGDNDGGVPGQDLQSVSIAEPKDLPGKIVLTMKVDDLSTPPPSTRWVTYYDAADGTTRYVAMLTGNGTPAFEYGVYGRDPSDTVGLYSPDGAPDDTSTYGADGTIVIVLDKAALGLKDGDVLENMSSSVRSTSAASGAGLTVDSTDGAAEYTLLGTAICDVVDVPVPNPNPQPPPVVRDSTRFGGAVGFALLLPLIGAALRRRHRNAALRR